MTMKILLWLFVTSLPIMIMFSYVQELSEDIRNKTLRGGGDNSKDDRQINTESGKVS